MEKIAKILLIIFACSTIISALSIYYTHQLPTHETKTTIETETLEDLAKIAEILARPILHTTTDKEHTFYIIDNNTKYQHKTRT
jgi:hypothetical protein